MPDYVERYNVIVTREVEYDSLGVEVGSTYKETILPLNWLMVLLFLSALFFTIKWAVKS